jgi:hypothetical protein
MPAVPQVALCIKVSPDIKNKKAYIDMILLYIDMILLSGDSWIWLIQAGLLK